MDKEKRVGIGESETPVSTGNAHVGHLPVLTAYDVLYLAHETMGKAFGDWIGTDGKSSEDLWYLWGIHDLAETLLTELEVLDVGNG